MRHWVFTKLSAIILAVAMILTLLPLSALAADTQIAENPTETQESSTLSTTDELTPQDELADSIDQATDGTDFSARNGEQSGTGTEDTLDKDSGTADKPAKAPLLGAPSDTPVAYIEKTDGSGPEYFYSLQDAVDHVLTGNLGNTIVLHADNNLVNESLVIDNGKTFILNLNGKLLTSGAEKTIDLRSGNLMIIDDPTANGTILNAKSDGYAIYVGEASNPDGAYHTVDLTLMNLLVENSSSKPAIYVDRNGNNSAINLNNTTVRNLGSGDGIESYFPLNVTSRSTIEAGGNGIIAYNNLIVNESKITAKGGDGIESFNKGATISGSEINGNRYGVWALDGDVSLVDTVVIASEDAPSSNYAAVYTIAADVTIDGGSYSGPYGAFSDASNGSITIYDGSFIGRKSAESSVYATREDGHQGSIIINGGYYSDANGNSDSDLYRLPSGKSLIQIQSGEYQKLYQLGTIIARRELNSGKTINYLSLEDAVSDTANSSVPIEMVTDTSVDSLDIGGMATIDLAGHTISITDTFKLRGSADVLIKDSTTNASGELVVSSPIEVLENAIFTVESGTVSSEGDVINVVKGLATIKGGSVTSTGTNGTALTVSDAGSASVQGGELSGGAYGIYLYNNGGSVVVSDGAVVKGSGDGKSVGVAEGGAFTINGGVFSDTEGNAEGFTRAEGKLLLLGINSEYPEMYALATVLAENVDTGKLYADLQKAIDTAENGQTIRLLHEIDLGSYSYDHPAEVNVTGKTLALDLNGYTLTASSNDVVYVNSGTLTIKDDVGGGKIENKDLYAVLVGGGGNLVLENGELVSTNSTALWVDGSNAAATATIKDGTINGKIGVTVKTATLTVENGKITGSETGVSVREQGTVNFNGGAVTGGTDAILSDTRSEFHLNGGYYSDNKANDGGSQYIFIEGGKLLIVGGSGEYKDYYTPVKVIAKIGEVEYRSLAEALEAAKDGDTIVMVNATTEAALNVDKQVTIDLVSYVVTTPKMSVTANVTIDASNKENPGSFKLTDESSNAGVTVSGGAQLTLSGGKIEAPFTVGVEVKGNGSRFVVNGGNVSGDGQGAIVVDQNATLDVSSGNVYGKLVGIFVGGGGATITGGTIEGTYNGVYLETGYATIQQTDESIPVIKAPKGESVENENSIAFTISGGAFSDNLGNSKDFIRPVGKNLLKIASGTYAGLYMLGETVAVNTRTDEGYATLRDALLDARTGDTIQMIHDSTETGIELDNNKILTLDLNNHAVTSNDSIALYIRNGKLTITDSSPESSSGLRGSIVDERSVTIFVNDNAELVLDNVIIGGNVPVSTYGQVTINGAILTGLSAGIRVLDGTVDINDGYIDGNDAVLLQGDYDPTVTINGGFIEGANGGNAVYVVNENSKGKVILKGGYYSDDKVNGYVATGKTNYEILDGKRLAPVDGADEPEGFFELQAPFTITYDLPDGAKNHADNPSTYFAGDTATLQAATHTDRDFQGWYKDETFTTVKDKIEKSDTGDLTFYAKFGPDKKALKDLVEQVPDPDIVTESETGSNVPEGNWWAPKTDRDAYVTALEAANNVIKDVNATEEQVTNAYAALNTAYNNLKKASVDKEALQTAIGSAGLAFDAVKASTDGKDVANGATWMTAEEKATLRIALEAAIAVLTDDKATQQQIDSATTALNNAKDAIKTAVTDKTALQNAVHNPVSYPVSDDDKGKDIPAGDTYMTTAQKQAYDAAITAAQAVLDNPDATQKAVDDALAALNAAAADTSTATVNKTALTTLFNSLTDPHDVYESTDGEDIRVNEKWATAENKAAYQAAYSAAVSVLNRPKVSQNQIDAAETELEAASANIITATLDTAALQQAYDDAPDDIETSTDGKNLPAGTLWMTEEEMAAYDAALDDAYVALHKAQTQNQIDSALEKLNTALQAIKTAGVDKTALEEAVNNASTYPESADGKDIPAGDQYMTPEDKAAYDAALQAAKDVLSNTSATQAEVDSALAALNEAAEKAQTAAVDKNDLTELFESLPDPHDVIESADGKDVPAGDLYATSEEKAAYQNAYVNAVRTLNRPKVAQNEVEEALTALNKTSQTVKTASPNADELKAAVENAVNPEDVNESADGKDISQSKKWATTDDIAAYAEALAAAKEVLANEKASQNDIDNALAALMAAAEKLQDGTLPRYKTTFDLNGGTLNGSTADIILTHDAGTVIKVLEAPTREGYEFVEWRGSSYQPGDDYTVTEDHTLTAQWKKIDSSGSKDTKTGDKQDTALWLILMAASLVLIGGAGVALSRRKKAK